MKRAIFMLIAVIMLTSCVTNHYTEEEYVKYKTKPMKVTSSFLTGFVPGLTQFLNGENIEGVIHIAGSLLPLIMSGFVNKNYQVPFILGAIGFSSYSYWDGVMSTGRRNDEYQEISMRINNRIAQLGREEKEKVFNLAKKRAEKSSMPVLIHSYKYIENDIYLTFTNISDKIIKYVNLSVVPYNRVLDFLDIENNVVMITDFIGQNTEFIGISESSFFNDTILGFSISSIEVIYTDNSLIKITSVDKICNGTLTEVERGILDSTDYSVGLPIFTQKTLKSK